MKEYSLIYMTGQLYRGEVPFILILRVEGLTIGPLEQINIQKLAFQMADLLYAPPKV